MAKKNDPNRPDSFLGRFVRFIIGAPTYDEWFGKSGKLAGAAESFINQQTGAHLTGAQTEANAFTAEQAQLNRDWQTEMSNTAYQRQVADMRAAGINPALAMQSASGATTPSGAAGSSVSPSQGASMSDLMQAFLLKKQGKLIDAQAQQARDTGSAALRQAGAAERNAASKESEVTIERQIADMRIRVGDSTVKLNEAQASKIAKETELVEKDIDIAELRRVATQLDIDWTRETWADNKRLLAANIGKALADKALSYALSSKADKESRALAMDNNWKEVFYDYWSKPENKDRGVNIDMLQGTNLGALGVAYIQSFGDNLDSAIQAEEARYNADKYKGGGSR